jgi:hypothetical protein
VVVEGYSDAATAVYSATGASSVKSISPKKLKMKTPNSVQGIRNGAGKI